MYVKKCIYIYICVYLSFYLSIYLCMYACMYVHPSGTWAIGADLRHPAVAPCFPRHWRGSFCVAFALQRSKDWGPRKLPMESNIWVSENGVYYHLELGVYFVFRQSHVIPGHTPTHRCWEYHDIPTFEGYNHLCLHSYWSFSWVVFQCGEGWCRKGR